MSNYLLIKCEGFKIFIFMLEENNIDSNGGVDLDNATDTTWKEQLLIQIVPGWCLLSPTCFLLTGLFLWNC